MNYAAIYEDLITRARSRDVSGYSERHHVVPRCMGGTDEVTNLVDLTPEEHYLAHQLLYRIHQGTEFSYKLMLAVHMMTVSSEKKPNRPMSKLKRFAWVRESWALEMQKRFKGKPNPKRSEQMKGKPGNRKGKKGSPEFCAMRSEAMKGKPGFFTGKTHSDETKEKLRAAFAGKKQELTTCPRCQKTGGEHAMRRYHFDKCKQATTITT